MSQMRKDIISGEWVIFASNRRKKPYAFKHNSKIRENPDTVCPFCMGHESCTTPERFRLEKDGNWEIRVFKNMYPAVDELSFEVNMDNFYDSMEGIGFHEVLVDTPVHNEELHEFSCDHIERVINVLKSRFALFEEMDEIKYVQIFKNNGPMAGASISHSHWQVIGVPIVPCEQERALLSFKNYKEKNGTCLMCDMAEHEIKFGERLVFENAGFAAFIPYAAKFSFEIWVVPKKHISSIAYMGEEEIKYFAEAIKTIISAVKDIKEDLCYNICFQDIPKGHKDEEFHWYMRILPRIGAPAGFEYGTGSYINPILPETAAETVREIIKNKHNENKQH